MPIKLVHTVGTYKKTVHVFDDSTRRTACNRETWAIKELVMDEVQGELVCCKRCMKAYPKEFEVVDDFMIYAHILKDIEQSAISIDKHTDSFRKSMDAWLEESVLSMLNSGELDEMLMIGEIGADDIYKLVTKLLEVASGKASLYTPNPSASREKLKFWELLNTRKLYKEV